MTPDEIGFLRMALDTLGIALTGHDHQWTPLERRAFEKSGRILSKYADPKKVDEERRAVAEQHSR